MTAPHNPRRTARFTDATRRILDSLWPPTAPLLLRPSDVQPPSTTRPPLANPAPWREELRPRPSTGRHRAPTEARWITDLDPIGPTLDDLDGGVDLRAPCDHPATVTATLAIVRGDGTVLGESHGPVTVCLFCHRITEVHP